MRSGMPPLEANAQLVEKIGKLDAAQGTGSQLLQQRAVQQLEALGDRKNLADPPRDLRAAIVAELIGQILNRRRVGGDPEQAGAGLVVQLVRDGATLLLLDGDELAIEATVLLAGGV